MESVVDQNLVGLLISAASAKDDDQAEEPLPESLSTAEGKAALKSFCRTRGGGHATADSHKTRPKLWQLLYKDREGVANVEANKDLYWDTVKTIYNSTEDLPQDDASSLPNLVDANHTYSFCLSNAGRSSLARLLSCVAYNLPDVTYCPLAYPLAASMRHYLSEEDTYGFLTNLLSSREPRYVSQGFAGADIERQTMASLNNKYNAKLVSQVARAAAISDEEATEKLLLEWPWAIFATPFTHVVRILDCFFVEGAKVLFRVYLVLVRRFCKELLSAPALFKISREKGLDGAFVHYCKHFPLSPNELLKRAFAVRGLSSKLIEKAHMVAEQDVKVRGVSGRPRSRSHDNLGASADAVKHIKNQSATLTHQQDLSLMLSLMLFAPFCLSSIFLMLSVKGLSTPQPRKRDAATFPIKSLNSAILSQSQLINIWNWIPERLTTVKPVLAYSSDEHGTSLTTFYSRCEPFEYSVLVVKATTGEVFGAFCSASWAERNYKDDRGMRQTYFGSGETFLFSLAGEKPRKYEWVGLKQTDQQPNVSKAEEHARQLFMSAQLDMLVVGGGNGNGLLLDAELNAGKSEPCATFANDPLCASGDFRVAIIEVFGLVPLDL